jgi:zinc protease
LLQFAYHVPAGNDPGMPAFELMMRILADGDASRLHRTLVEEQQLAISVDTHLDQGFDPGLFWLFLSLPSQGDAQQAEQAFDAQMERFRTSGVTAEELARARNQALADFWRGMATIDGKASALGEYAVLKGGYQKLFDVPRAYEQVTVEDIRKIAEQYLRVSNRTVGILTPTQNDKEGA